MTVQTHQLDVFWKLFLIKIFIGRLSRVTLNICPLDIKLKFFAWKREHSYPLSVTCPSILFDILAINEWPFKCNESDLIFPTSSPIKRYSYTEVLFIEKIKCFMNLAHLHRGSLKKCMYNNSSIPSLRVLETCFFNLYLYLTIVHSINERARAHRRWSDFPLNFYYVVFICKLFDR